MNRIQIIPSLLSIDFSCLRESLRDIPDEIDMLHLDIMDGNFVNNISFGPMIVNTIRKNTDKLLDVHLMINNPDKYIDDFHNADLISFHIETVKDVESLIKKIQSMKKKVGIAVNPETSIDSIESYFSMIDYILIMSVHPGFAGQTFIYDVLDKIKYLSNLKNRNFFIEIDGGINAKTAAIAYENGAEWFVSGSYIFNTNNINSKIQELKHAIS